MIIAQDERLVKCQPQALACDSFSTLLVAYAMMSALKCVQTKPG